VPAVLLGRIDPYAELRAQIERILASGIRPAHIDAHKHAHLLPGVLKALVRLAAEYGIGWVRAPFDARLDYGQVKLKTRLTSRVFELFRGHFQRTFAHYGLRSTDHFVGFQLTGRMTAEALLKVIEQLPEGSTELMTHPGVCDAELMAAPTRLRESRAVELAALMDARVEAALERRRVEPGRYR
jgi:predicted glycoside hydrolase/deacetylase ChbG (UPF0249 family)